MNTSVLELSKELTGHEQQVFELLSNRDVFTSRAEIEARLYGDAVRPSNCVQVFVLRMRKKGIVIEMKRGRGYRLGQAHSHNPPPALTFDNSSAEQPQ